METALELTDGLHASVMDMHVHTLGTSSDSMLEPDEVPEIGRAAGLTGVNFAEHDRTWEGGRQGAFLASHDGFFANFGMEVSTDLGHMIAIGLKEYMGGIREMKNLRRVLDRRGGFLIVAHPFRHAFDAITGGRTGHDLLPRLPGEAFDLTPEQAAELPVFDIVDAIEAANASNTLQENEFAYQVGKARGIPCTGGSDAHSSSGVGRFATGFEREITSAEEFLEELKAGRFEAVHRTAAGRWVRFEPGSVDAAEAEAAGG